MKNRSTGFTLIEVMLAVAIFAFAVVGFGVALNDVLGVNSEILRTAQRRQAIESVAAQILARSNNFAESGWTPVPGWGSETTWTLSQKVQPVLVNVPGPNNTVVQMEGWWRVDLRAQDEKEKVVDQIGFILWGQR
ncbi:MAG: type II secretion system protein J [Planctomycetota bacterium]